MDVVEKEQDDDKMDIQASYSSLIKEFRKFLLQWLKKEPESNEIEDFEDQDLDALLLKVPQRQNVLR